MSAILRQRLDDACAEAERKAWGDWGDGPTWDPIPETCEEALARWDRGESVFTVEMGGLGPGYEQCIQIVAFELLRAFLGKPLAEESRALNDAMDVVVCRVETECQLGLSGAQAGAAKNLAYHTLKKGWRAALAEVPERHIQVCRAWPKAPEPPR